ANTCSATATCVEVVAVLKKCHFGKSPGPDRLGNDLYRRHGEQLVPILTPVYNACWQAGVVPRSFQEASVMALPKVATPRTGLDVRPISFLNTDYKLYARILATRLHAHLPQLISRSQSGFVHSRSIHDAIDRSKLLWLQHIRLVRAVALPIIRYTARHIWPSTEDISMVQKGLDTFIWSGSFSPLRRRRGWVSRRVAELSPADGGICYPRVRF
ncbi:TPA: hypothetical protein N0F65_006569, partial [Lagenidium giganteum]